MTEWRQVLVNGRWPLWLTGARAERPHWPWWERQRLLAMRCAIRPGTLVVDVGAELGDLTALYGTWGADVAVVEPVGAAWPTIRATWEMNIPDRVPPWCFAGFCSDEERADTPDPGWPAATDGPLVDEPGYLHLDRDTTSPRTSVDELRAWANRPVDVVTMDVEGAEWSVLRGAERTLERDRPTLFVSVHARQMLERYGEFSDDLLIWLDKVAGYECIEVGYDHESHVAGFPRP